MRKANAILAGAVAGLGLISTAQALPIVSTRLELYDISDAGVVGVTPIPQIANVYQVTQGQHFIVQLEAKIVPPANRTDTITTRSSATRNKPLGIQNLTVDIRSTPGSGIAPVDNGSGQWSQYTDLMPNTGLAFSFCNVTDRNADGTIDVAGAGFTNGSFSTGTTAGSLRGVQYGVDSTPVTGDVGGVPDGTPGGSGNNFTSPQNISNGEYQALSLPGTYHLATVFLSGNVYSEDTVDTGNAVKAVAIPAGDQSNADIQIHVTAVPEPASLGLLGLSGLALVRRRRR